MAAGTPGSFFPTDEISTGRAQAERTAGEADTDSNAHLPWAPASPPTAAAPTHTTSFPDDVPNNLHAPEHPNDVSAAAHSDPAMPEHALSSVPAAEVPAVPGAYGAGAAAAAPHDLEHAHLPSPTADESHGASPPPYEPPAPAYDAFQQQWPPRAHMDPLAVDSPHSTAPQRGSAAPTAAISPPPPGDVSPLFEPAEVDRSSANEAGDGGSPRQTPASPALGDAEDRPRPWWQRAWGVGSPASDSSRRSPGPPASPRHAALPAESPASAAAQPDAFAGALADAPGEIKAADGVAIVRPTMDTHMNGPADGTAPIPESSATEAVDAVDADAMHADHAYAGDAQRFHTADAAGLGAGEYAYPLPPVSHGLGMDGAAAGVDDAVPRPSLPPLPDLTMPSDVDTAVNGLARDPAVGGVEAGALGAGEEMMGRQGDRGAGLHGIDGMMSAYENGSHAGAFVQAGMEVSPSPGVTGGLSLLEDSALCDH